MIRLMGLLLLSLYLNGCGFTGKSIDDTEKEHLNKQRWSTQKANNWYAQQPWLVGVNFIPSTAINQLEMWQADTFDPETIARELDWAADLGMNVVRVYLHDLAWEQDPEGFKERIDTFLELAWSRGIKTSLVIFDDVWNPEPRAGKQPEPVPGIHNSGWIQSPGPKVVNDPTAWKRLERYVTDILTTFSHDERVIYWDLYNEPGNEGQDAKSLPLLRETFRWARTVNPSQPLTTGVWYKHKTLNSFALAASDIISFHNYNDLESMKAEISKLKSLGRPVICTEWMARTEDSLFQTHLPLMKQENVGSISWGLVSGKSQTIYPWNSPESEESPKLWFHDILHTDGSPYNTEEVDVIQKSTSDLADFSTKESNLH